MSQQQEPKQFCYLEQKLHATPSGERERDNASCQLLLQASKKPGMMTTGSGQGQNQTSQASNISSEMTSSTMKMYRCQYKSWAKNLNSGESKEQRSLRWGCSNLLFAVVTEGLLLAWFPHLSNSQFGLFFLVCKFS